MVRQDEIFSALCRYVSVHEHSTHATPDQLSQNYAVCDLGDKLNMLWSFVKSHKRKKLLVFVQSCKQAKYFTELFKRLRCGTTGMVPR